MSLSHSSSGQKTPSDSKTGYYNHKPSHNSSYKPSYKQSHKSPPVYTTGFYSPFIRSGDQDGKYNFSSKETKILLSNYGTFNPSFIIGEIKKQSSGKDIYILGVKYRSYWDDKAKEMTLDDSQLTVTGTPNFGESLNDGMLRELREEIGGNIDNITNLPQFSSLKKGRIHKTYFINVASLSKIPDSEKSKTYEDNPDRSRKIEIAIVGTLDEFRMFFDRVDCRLNDDDKIDGCVLFSFEDFLKHCGV
jgi:hypothetical protein